MDKTQKTIIAYDKNSKIYAEKFMNFDIYTERIKDFIKFIKVKDIILDLGCGPGNVAKQLELCGKEISVTGIDLSEEMIELARRNVPSATLYCQDIRDIEFKEKSFDAIILSFCIVHLSDEEMVKLIEKVSRYLKKNGKLYLSFMEGKKKGFETTSFSKEEIFFNYYLTEEVELILENNGIGILKIVKQDYPEPDGTLTTDVFVFAEKE
ncbi:MAG: class I SAM-dependent methyltransferase [Desulfosporosinus sp.]|nr:class I SAM-dependent methyltransferase [Desulfosporosinus sp.]